MRVEKSFLVGVSLDTESNEGVLIVGLQEKGKVDILNAFSGKEAVDIYKKLITKKEAEQ